MPSLAPLTPFGAAPSGPHPSASAAVAQLRAALPELGRHIHTAITLVKTETSAAPPPLRPIPTSTPLDALLGGGLPRGELVEIHGHRSSGRFSLALSALAAATSSGETTAFVDLGDHLEAAAAVALGAELDRLLWVRPRRLSEALAAAEMLLQTGFALVVVDLGLPPIRGGRGAEGSWQRLARAAHAAGSALLVSAPYRATGTAAAAVLSLASARTTWSGSESRLLERLEGDLVVEKRRGTAAGRAARLGWRSPSLPTPSFAPAPLPAESIPRAGGSALRRVAAR